MGAQPSKKIPKSVDPIFLTLFRSQPTKGDLKKIQIVEAAIRIIGEEGIEYCTFEALGKRLGTRRSHVVYYFKSVDEIVEYGLQFILRKGYEYIVRAMEGSKTEQQRLEAYLESNFDWVRENPWHASLFVLFYYYATFRPKFRKMQEDIRRTAVDRITALVDRYLEEKKLKLKKSSMETAASIHSLLTGRFVYLLTTAQFDQVEAVNQAKRDVIEGVGALLRA